MGRRGLTLPGYNYLGPFNSLDNGEPVNNADSAAKEHDHWYDSYLKTGSNPYLYFNKADQQFIDDTVSDYSFGGLLGRAVFSAKKAIAPVLTRSQERAAQRHLYFLRSNKRPKESGPKKGEPKKAKMAEPAADNAPPEEAMPEERAGGGGGGAGGGGGGLGGGGVGISTGGWSGGTIFSDSFVVTKQTRQFICTPKNNHQYIKEYIQVGRTEDNISDVHINKSQHCVATPWCYFNFNGYFCHFTPQDWQRLCNEYVKFRPKKMRVQLYNLQIKQVQVPTGGGDPVYTNDLTAGVHVFCDGDHEYPYAQHPWDDDCLPEIPTDVYQLFQYGYMTGETQDINQGDVNKIEARIVQNMPLFFLENSDHAVLRTGESIEFNYTFDCEWQTNSRSYINYTKMQNPLIPSRVVQVGWQGENQGAAYQTPNGAKPTNFMGGPGIGSYYGYNPNPTTGPIESGPLYSGNRFATYGSQFVSQPDSVAPTGGVYPVSGSLAPGRRGDMTLNFLLPGRSSTTPTNGLTEFIQGGTTYNYAKDFHYFASLKPGQKPSEIRDMWMLPNQIWDRQAVTRYSAIWCKKPRADKNTIIDPEDGTLAMDNPPGTIFIKMAKIPVPSNPDSFLNIYCTGQVSCEILWEVQRYKTKNWRPECRISSQNMQIIKEDKGHNPSLNDQYFGMYDISQQGNILRPMNWEECMPTKMYINRVL